METFIFGTYLLSLIAFVSAIYAIIEVRDMKQELRRKKVEEKLKQVTNQPIKKPKGLWN